MPLPLVAAPVVSVFVPPELVPTPVPALPVPRSLSSDPLIAIVVAFLLTWACHSSVAIVLLVASLAASQVIGTAESFALVLGANLGGAMPALLPGISQRIQLLIVGLQDQVAQRTGLGKRGKVDLDLLWTGIAGGTLGYLVHRWRRGKR